MDGWRKGARPVAVAVPVGKEMRNAIKMSTVLSIGLPQKGSQLSRKKPQEEEEEEDKRRLLMYYVD